VLLNLALDLMGAGFDWEEPAWRASPSINATTVAARAQIFVEFINSTECSVYRGPCMLLWGADFRFHDAEVGWLCLKSFLWSRC
jgi:hypothetical protein